MKEETVFTSVSPDGKINEGVRDRINKALVSFAGKRIYFKLGIARKIRSLDQNSYYHGVVVACLVQGVLEQWGEKITSEQAHEMLKTNCNANGKIDELTSKQVRIPMPTHSLSTIEFEEYQDRCRVFIAEMFGIDVPAPNSQLEII
jgi:hypothetical protein